MVKTQLTSALGSNRIPPRLPAEADKMPYVADVKRAKGLIGHSVGTGQCVAFIEGVMLIPTTPAWHRGATVKGNTSIAPGTVIAVFDATGRYGNHTNGSSHA
ncbi:BPSL0067 family protein, partial [Endosaccharibacter trunci]|uniref:BPSL0067 family protein n=1 Tax=Endosaccharibacter trunci TaxID=2812733 RepID=UPI003BF54150